MKLTPIRSFTITRNSTTTLATELDPQFCTRLPENLDYRNKKVFLEGLQKFAFYKEEFCQVRMVRDPVMSFDNFREHIGIKYFL